MSEIIKNETRIFYDPCLCGTENYHLYAPLGKDSLSLLLTDSVIHFANDKKAFWTIDVVYSHLPTMLKHMKDNDTNIIFLYFDVADGKCEFYAKLDSDKQKRFEQKIEYTDLDVSVELYLQDGILFFPSDY